jgi:hypothetical protein
VHIKLPTATTTLQLPVDALIFKSDGLQVASVDAHNRVTLVSVTSGRDFGDTVEILSGLTGGERVISNPPDSLSPGDTVRVVTQPGAPAAAARP